MSFSFHAGAKEEFVAAVEWYESRSPGLGEDFATEVLRTIQRAVAMPEAWPRVSPNLRRIIAHRFPYAILYAVDDGTIVVFAVMHTRRQPYYWRNRVQ